MRYTFNKSYLIICIVLSTLFLGEECNESGLIIKLAPNPASDFTEITISLNSDAVLNISIYDSMGDIVKEVEKAVECKSGDTPFHVDVRNLKNGVYLVRIVMDNFQKTEKLVVLR